jgi:integrase
LGASISELIKKHKPVNAQPDDLVFQTPKGNAIDDHNFRNRAWVTVLKEQGVIYRKPYNMRSTFISHALSSGMNPMTVAQITGHDPKTMFSHYAGFINNLPTTPELF